VKAKEPIPGLLQAVGDRTAFQAPFAQERLAPDFDIGGGVGVDHVAVVLGQLVVHELRGMAEKVAVLVHRAPLDRQLFAPERNEGGFQPGSAIDNDEVRSLQATRIEIGEEPARGTRPMPPCFRRPCS